MRGNSVQTDPALTIELLKDLIKIPSINPTIEGRGEGAIADYISTRFRKAKKFHVYEQRVTRNRFNIVAILKGSGEGRSLMFNGHMDTVGTTGMTVKPFRPFVERGRMHGRGACDMKGSIAAMMSAMLAIANSNEKPAGDIMFTGVVDEEYLSIGMWNLIKRFRTDAAIVGEPTDMDIAVAHKGYVWLEIETIGKRAHGSVPEKGVDAIENMGKILAELEALRGRYRRMKHSLLGIPKIHTSFISGGIEWAIVPASCVLRLERRLLPNETPADSVRELRELVNRCKGRNGDLRAKVRLIYQADSLEVDANTPHVRALKNSVRRLGGKPRIVGAPYWTDASILTNRAKIPSCLFGPGNIQVAHAPDEYVNIKDAVTAAQVYANTALQFCS